MTPDDLYIRVYDAVQAALADVSRDQMSAGDKQAIVEAAAEAAHRRWVRILEEHK